MRRVWFYVLLLIIFLSLGMISYLNSHTLIELKWPALIVLLIVAATGLRWSYPWQRLTNSTRGWINYICHITVGGTLLLLMFYAMNYWGADNNTIHHEDSVVVKKYSKTHYKSRRIRKNVYGRGEPYQVYNIVLKFPSGIEKHQEISVKRYRKIHVGDTIDTEVKRGLLGVNVVK